MWWRLVPLVTLAAIRYTLAVYQPKEYEVSDQPKRRRATGPRAAPKPSAAFFIIQVLDEEGQPQPFSKQRVKIVGIERSAEKVLELVENGEHEHAFYLRGMVPVARNVGQRKQQQGA